MAAPVPPPMAAPAAAPSAVPTAAVPTPLDTDARFGLTPLTCSLAYCLQFKSSPRNWSKFLPEPGRTITLGPEGMLTQALRKKTEHTTSRADNLGVSRISYSIIHTTLLLS